MANSHSSPFLRLSLRGLFSLVTLVAVAIVSLKFGGDIWWIVLSGVAMLIFMAMVVVAILDRDSRQAFAIGSVVFAGLYGILLILVAREHKNEFDLYDALLPTSKILTYAYEASVNRTWINMTTGEVLADFDPSQNTMGLGVYVQEIPPRTAFMSIGHVLWAIFLGLIGGYFGRLVDSRRKKAD